MDEVPPVVSVVIPCYNGEPFIRGAIGSVLDQTFSELEVVVVNDGSTDGSRHAIEEFRSDPRLRYIEHGENRGIATTRNSGIRHSRGDYIAFLDQDDLWRPDKLAKQVDALERSGSEDVGLVFSDVEVVEEANGKKKHRYMKAPPRIDAASRLEILRALFMRNFIPIVSAMIRRRCFEAVGMLDDRIRSGADDYDLCFRLAMKYRFAHIPEPLVIRRIHGRNYTDIEKLFPDALMILGRVIEETPELTDLKHRRLSDLHDRLAGSYLFKGDLKRARRMYRQSSKYRRSNVKAFLGMMLCSGGSLGHLLGKLWLSRRML